MHLKVKQSTIIDGGLGLFATRCGRRNCKRCGTREKPTVIFPALEENVTPKCPTIKDIVPKTLSEKQKKKKLKEKIADWESSLDLGGRSDIGEYSGVIRDVQDPTPINGYAMQTQSTTAVVDSGNKFLSGVTRYANCLLGPRFDKFHEGETIVSAPNAHSFQVSQTSFVFKAIVDIYPGDEIFITYGKELEDKLRAAKKKKMKDAKERAKFLAEDAARVKGESELAAKKAEAAAKKPVKKTPSKATKKSTIKHFLT
ncbi:hypothetical protein DFA_02854 [Cavenderia fasciculata]|uniref:SET domain-containing protein n=1 Tax=Cavenderia fasciculata TaxID=261658 RepID=F4PIN1_CACFS|nr:uncharacterized protein DFA_03731 [Cavenderia fasciculata]XP_004362462.1 uncharacterized protein DFA_02854 [Cavenderia fasciculata]EGG18244.1 hypothetical protein DFA_03731 [Cavenderia fasciculata]EGG24611.1 hypothetical protein DFA_02854 [Cavenderia fasciculata]|eukprot:XP_004357067.1 hypothetical protein DFA_03731 [Cavenderia fasciculata]